MPLYKAEIYDRSGIRKEISEESLSESEFVRKLSSQDCIVTSVKEVHCRRSVFKVLRTEDRNKRKKQLSLDDQYLYCITMSSYLKSGISVTEILRLLQKQTRNKQIIPIYTELRESVEGGRSLAASMRLSGVFRESLAGMVESGERSASLPAILERSAELLQNEITLRRKLRSSLTYPLLMLVVGLCVTVFLLTFVVPRLTALVVDSGAELPFVTRLLIGISDAVSISLPFAAVGVLLAIYLMRRKGIRISAPMFRDIKENIAFAMIFTQTGTLLKAGLSLTEALKLTEPLDPVSGRLAAVADNIKKGYRFSQSLEKEGSFPEEIISVVRVGEGGRDLSDGLIRLGNSCWDIAQTSMQRYATLAEPLIILAMGFIVGFVVIAVLLPVFDLSTLAVG